MTGPATEINFMGYAAPGQRGQGIHLRLWARSFIVSDESKTVCFVSVDGGMASDLVKLKVIEELNSQLGEGIFTTENLSISGTHTHSGPAGFLQYVLYQVTSLGFVQETFDAWVKGIASSVVSAYKNMQDGSIRFAQGDLYDANINRSPTSYLRNPEEERNQYPEGDTDKNMFLLNFLSKSGKSVGVLNWFAVHATSMNNTNTLVSGDNKGYASYALEKDINGASSTPGTGPFVAAFASTNLGDVSPNTNGPKCIDTGLPCDGSTSTCNGKCENCIAFGPGTNGDMFESTKIIGDRQYQFAKKLMQQAVEEVSGPVDFRHVFVDMTTLNVTLSTGDTKTLCTPAMGYSFAAGTTDGPGMFGFTQGTTSGNPFWDKVRDFLSEPTEEEIACHAPKPILLNTADIRRPYQWDPTVVPLQLFRIGNVFIISVPSEFTTMAGRRLRKVVKQVLVDANVAPGQEIHVTIAGLANTYSSYVTTYEEYLAQRYEAASTIFGPHTLEGYLQEYARIAGDLVAGRPSVSGPPPPNLYDIQLELMPAHRFDRVPENVTFGDVVEGKDVLQTYRAGDTIQATFYSANPRNNQRPMGTFLTVEKLKPTGRYEVIATDSDWNTKFRWVAGPEDPLDFGVSALSQATITWTSPAEASAGTYRLCHFGDHKIAKTAKVVPFTGCSSSFTITA